jgi:putative DNA primase/helicase
MLNEKINGANGSSPPDNEEPPSQVETKKKPRPTDDELGDLFLSIHREHYCYFYGEWHGYERGLWTASNGVFGQHIRDMMQVLKAKKGEGIFPSVRKAHSVLDYCALYRHATDEDLERGQHYINLRNGLFNLETFKLEDHQRGLYFTSQLPFAYDPDAQCLTWKKFLRSVLKHDNGAADGDMISVVQEAIGYSLTANTDHRVSCWLVGPSGSGKSTLINAIIRLAGNSHATIDLDALKHDRYQLANLVGKRLITFSEPETGGVLADGVYKRLVSKDPIEARKPYGDPFFYVPIGKLWGSMNDTPRVIDRSDAVFSRVMIFPMNRVIPKDERDINLHDKLMAELPGIFNWAMMGLRRLNENGKFSTSSQMDEARREFRADNDTEAAFVEDECITDGDAKVKARALYAAYKDWCYLNGYRAKSERAVAKDWVRMGFRKVRNNGSWYHGVGLRTDSRADNGQILP